MDTTAPRSKAGRGLLVGILSIAVLLLSGCFRMDMNFELHENDTADLTMEVVDTSGFLFDPEYGGGSCEDLFSEMGTDVPEGGEFKSEEFTTDDDKKGCLMSLTGAPLDEITSDISDGGGIQRVGDEFVIELPADPSSTEEISSLPGVEINVSFTFPGQVIDAGSGTVSEDGRTVTFAGTSAFTDGVSIKGSAASEDNTMVTVMFIVLGVLLLAGVVGGILVYVSRKNKSKDAQGYSGPPSNEYQGAPTSNLGYSGAVPGQQGYQGAPMNGYGQPAQQNYDPANPYAGYTPQQPGQSPSAGEAQQGSPLPPPPQSGQQPTHLPPPPPSAPSPDANSGHGNEDNRDWRGDDWDSSSPR